MGYMKMLFLQLSFVCLSLAELGVDQEFELENLICSCREKGLGEQGDETPLKNLNPLKPISKPLDCNDIQKMGQTISGRYIIYPFITGTSGEAVHVWCDMDTDGGGWTVLQRRQDGSVDFNVEWDEYKDGFGYLGGEFWLGNENIRVITNQKDYELQVEIEEYSGNSHVHHYDHFRLTDASNEYTLYTGTYTGTEEVCEKPMGMKDGRIKDSQITASTQHSSAENQAKNARLDLSTGSWYAATSNKDQWIQVNFGVPKLVTGVVMQGRHGSSSQRVTTYKVQHGNDGKTWQYVMDSTHENEMVFPGNTHHKDVNTHVTSNFARPVKATYIRIQPITWYSVISMRFELLGCDGDFLAYQKDQAFSTKDVDNDDVANDNCAATRGAWWYGACEDSGLNGPYLMGAGTTTRGIIWEDFDGQVYSIRRTQIKTRPVDRN